MDPGTNRVFLSTVSTRIEALKQLDQFDADFEDTEDKESAFNFGS